MQIVIKKGLLIPTRKEGYKDIYKRTHSLSLDNNSLDQITNMFVNKHISNSQKITEFDIANNCPNVMSLGANTTGMSNIIHGWGTQRIKYMLEAESYNAGSIVSTYVQGYTEYYDPTITGKLDPNMKFYINSISVVVRTQDPVSKQWLPARPLQVYNVISNTFTNEASYEQVTDEESKYVRPLDIANHLSMDKMYGEADNINFSSALMGNVVTSERTNNNPLKHFAKTINGYISANSLADMSYDMSDVIDTISTAVPEPNILSNPFMAKLSQITGIATPDHFTLNNLASIMPNVHEVLTISDNNSVDVFNTTNTIADATDTEDTYKSTLESVVSAEVAFAVAGILTDNLITEFSFRTTNITGPCITTPAHVNSFMEGVDLRIQVNKVVNYIDDILFPHISKHGQIMVELIVVCDVLGEATVSIGFNGNHPVLFRYPLLADSLFSPVISNTTEQAHLADNFGTIMDSTMAITQEGIY